MAISDSSKPFIDNLLERTIPSSGFVGKGEFEIRLTEPVDSLNSQGALVNGLEELFHQTERSATHRLIFLICSAWLSAEAFRRLFDSLEGRGHHLFIITHRGHEANHWVCLANTWKKLRTKFSLIGVATLPRKDGSLPLNADALHAKLYAVGLRPPTVFSKSNAGRQNLLNIARTGIASMAPIECFFGSANFTTGGLGQKIIPNMKYDLDKKWEVVGRATNESGMRAITETFSSLWRRADVWFVDKEEYLTKNFSHNVPELVYQSNQTQQKKRSNIVLVLKTILLTSAAFIFIMGLVRSCQAAAFKEKKASRTTSLSLGNVDMIIRGITPLDLKRSAKSRNIQSN